MGLSERLRVLEQREPPGYCRHQPVVVRYPAGCDWEPPPAPPRRCWCGQEPLCVEITYADGPRWTERGR